MGSSLFMLTIHAVTYRLLAFHYDNVRLGTKPIRSFTALSV
jgi:hypothetical protein